MSSILALDPGGTTGWAYQMSISDTIDIGHIGPGAHHKALYVFLLEKLSIDGDLTIVCESFEYRKNDKMRDKIVLDSVEYIGIVKLFVECNPLARLVMQSAATGKGFWTDVKLKKAGLWTPGMKHAMDAMRHMQQYKGFTLGDTSVFMPLKGDDD